MIDSIDEVNSIFEQPWWLDTVAFGKWGAVTVKDSDKVIARLPYVFERNRIVMPPLTQTLGPWIHPDYRKQRQGNTQTTIQKELIRELMGQLPKYKSFDMTFDHANDYILPYRWLGFSLQPTFSYRLNDLSDLDRVQSNLNKTVKKNIRSGMNKTCISSELDVEALFLSLDESFSAQNRKYPHSIVLIEKIVKNCVSRDSGRMFIARDGENNVHASAFIIYDERTCYYLLGGSSANYRSSGAQSLVLWEAIQFASTTSKAFDFEGSMVEGIENFFRQFGGEQVVNYNVTKHQLHQVIMSYYKPKLKRLIGYKL